MGGKGELVDYIRERAKSKAQREKLKQKITDLVDQSALAHAITIIALVQEATKGRRKGRRKVRRKIRRKLRR